MHAVAFARDLADHGNATALFTADGDVTYRDLATRAAAVGQRLGTRKLILLAATNTVDALAAYLAALAAGHPVLLAPGDRPDAVEELIAAYDPDAVIRGDAVELRRTTTAHDLHPDLAVLLSTSGSTGSPKLVRLSHANIEANAAAIAEYLDIRPSDRAATTLPMHYCYGLSIIHSHLLRGAGLILTGLSVSDSCFWDLFRRARGTALAGVPYTFDLLDRVGFADLDLPHLRYVTQAGGRLAPERVTAYAQLGRRRGFDLYVMYGQTEATARMAYLPPDLAATRPQAIGVPIPGGRFRLEPVPEATEQGTGELVYTGRNVMLGYATGPADLGLGRTVDELRTGDLARRAPDGLYEITGRRSAFLKVFGVRVDPRHVEARLATHGIAALVTGDDEAIIVAAEHPDPARVTRLTAAACGLPARRVRVQTVAALPRLASGKPDYEAVRAAARPHPPAVAAADATVASLCRLYADILGVDGVDPDRSFADLGGDSLSYVEMSLRLEQLLGDLPTQWHTTPIRALVAAAPPAPSRIRRIDTSVALRAIAIVLIVGTHIPVFKIPGGAHLLLGVAGYNFARFQLTGADRRTRGRHMGRAVAEIAVPTIAWTALMMLLTSDYGPWNLALLHGVLGPRDSTSGWHLWFLEALVWLLVGALALLAVPAVDRLERRAPFAVPIGLAALGLLTRYDLLGIADTVRLPGAVRLLWLFALGWAAAKAATVRHKVLVTLAVAVTVPGFFGEPGREALVVGGLALLIWVPTLPSLRPVNRVAGLLAGASLYIYLTHWQVFPRLRGESTWLAFGASLLIGVAFWACVGWARPWVTRAWGGLMRSAR
ncbi:MAG: AMP-binding protein [Hamadaea sp.]|nr:AMP-binding protein [Hamadaea sp.]